MTAEVTSTTNAGGLLVRIERHDNGYLAADLTGLRYGFADTLEIAVSDWLYDVCGILEIDNIGEPLLSEANAYRNVLGMDKAQPPAVSVPARDNQ